MNQEQPLRYQSYLLRCWLEASRDGQQWRFSLEDTNTHKQHRFATLTELVVALHTTLFGALGDHADKDQ